MTALRTWGAVTATAVMAGSLAACGGSSKAMQSAVSLTTTTAKVAPTPSQTPTSSQASKSSGSAGASSQAPSSQAPACKTADLDKPLRAANLRGVSGQYATVGHNPTCMGNWWIENVYDAGDAMAILEWKNNGWQLVTSSNMSICQKQLEADGAPASLISYAKQSGGLAPTCGTPAMTSPFGASSSPQTAQNSAPTSTPVAHSGKSLTAAFFNNATFITDYAGTVTFHNGYGVTTGGGMSLPAGLPHTPNGLAGGPEPVFGDVNHDGIPDAVVQIAVQDGNGVSIEESLWIGAANGTAKQLGKPFLTTGRCGFTITSHKITSSGTIQVSGGGMGQACGDSGTGPAYTAQYKVVNNKIITIQGPPE